MINNLSPNFLVAMSQDGRTPIQLLVMHFEAGDVFLSDRDITVDGVLYDGIVESWGSLTTVGAENAVSSTMELDITLWNGGNSPFSDNFLNKEPFDVFVDVYQTFDGLLESDFAHIGEFVIQDPIGYTEASQLLQLELVTTNMRYFAQVGTLLTKDKYPNALSADINKSIDLIIGDAGSINCLCSKKPSFATTTGSFLTNPTKVYVHDDLTVQGFLESGYIQIDDEIMEYTSRADNYFNVTTRGIFGTISSDHSDGSEVTQANTDSEYIVGQSPLTSITDVKVNGQTPTISYTTHNVDGVSLIRFPSQPTYFEYSKGARSLDENFDAPASDNTAYHAEWAYDTENKSLGAIIEKSTPRLSVLQNDAPIDEGEIVKLFLNVEHWATKAYANDRVDVYVDGVNNNNSIGFLNRPNASDIINVGGEVDLDHEHEHSTGESHTHDSVDPDFASNAPLHRHDLDGSEESVSGLIDSGERVTSTSGQYFYYNPYKKEQTKTYVSFRITNGVVGISFTLGSKTITVNSDTVGITFQAWTTSNTRFSAKVSSGYADVVFINNAVEVFFSDNSTEDQLLDISTSKSASGAVDGIQQNTSVIKAIDDVDPLVEDNQDLIMTLQENSSRSVSQRFDITKYLETIDWSWIVGRKVSLQFVDSSTAETPEIVVTYINFEVEYRQRQVLSTDVITCSAIGSIENRPDAVVEYLLTQKAGLPIEKLGSIYRDVPKWDDIEIWDDTGVWIDEGQVSGAVDGAAFEEASAWFDFHDYTVDGVLSGSSSIKDAIAKITFQTRSKLTWQNGFAKLSILRKNEDWLIAKNIPINDIQLKSYEASKSEASKIVNKIDLFHSIDRLDDASDSGQYEETSYVSDITSIAKHGEKVQENMWLFDMVRNSEMADSLADYYLWEMGEPSTYYTFRTYLKNFDLEKEDYATINSYKFAKLKQLPVVIKEIQRDFGSGKLSKINTLNMVCQSIRHYFHIVGLDDSVLAADSLNIDFGFELFFDEAVSFSELLEFNWGKDFTEDVGTSEVFSILARFHEKLTETIVTNSEVISHIDFVLSDSVLINDELSVARELCYSACGYGCPDGVGVQYGSQTVFKDFPFEAQGISDILGFIFGTGVEDTQAIGDTLAFSDGYGCLSGLGDGYGLSPYNC